MAEIKKFLDLTTGLPKLVEEIKEADAKVLSDAKAYCDSKDSQFEVAGAAKTAKEEAIANADAKIATVNENLAKKADQTALDVEVTRATEAEAANKALAEAAQADVDALETLVGTLPDGTTAKTIREYVDVKTAGIATDAALGELQGQVSAAQEAIDAIEADYLKAADKTELSDAIAVEKERAEGIEGGLRTDVDAIKADYLKTADKTELQGNIDVVDAKADEVAGKVTTLVGDDVNKSVRTIANEELAKQLIAEGAQESLDTLGEIAAWIQSHPDDASAMSKAISDLEALVGTLPEGITATDIVGYIQEVVAAEKARAEGVESGLDARLQAVEDKFGNGEGNVESQIESAVSTAKQEAISEAVAQAAEDAEEKDAALKTEVNGYTDTKISELTTTHDADMEAVNNKIGEVTEGKTVVQMIADAQTAATYDDTQVKADIKTNADAIAELLAKHNTDKTELQASIDTLVADLATETTTARAAEKANADAISALQTQHNEDKVTLQASIDANTSAINSFVSISAEEIDALFA